MSKKSYHVIAKSNGDWSVKRNGAERASGNFSTKAAAVSSAKKLVSKDGGGELIVHGKDGTISRRDTYGKEMLNQLNKMSIEELREQADSLKESLFRLKFKKSLDTGNSVSDTRRKNKTLARVKISSNQREQKAKE